MMDRNLESLGSLGLGTPTPSPPPGGGGGEPRLVHKSATTAVYRLHGAGFKVLLDPSPSEEQILRLLHEQRVSEFLPPGCHRRRVTDVASFNKRPALCFEWASGITLGEWMRRSASTGLGVRLRAAMAVSRTVSEFHEGGVAYNGLRPENVVLSPSEGDYVATLIDLSRAVIYRKDEPDGGVDPAFESQMKAVDLESLGAVLGRLFRGDDGGEKARAVSSLDGTAQEEVDGDRRSKRGKLPGPGEGLPLYLCSLISALVDTKSSLKFGRRYKSAKDVYLDLKAMAEDASGHLLRSEVDESTAKGLLRLGDGGGGMFYGRQVQMSMLLHLFQSGAVLGSQPLMATIAGLPGTGKSTLVNQIKKPLLDLNGHFIDGKFNKSADRPDTVLASALNSFFASILGSDRGNRHVSMKWRIHDAIGSVGNGALMEILPSLQKWMADGGREVDDEEGADDVTRGLGSSHRLKFMFCKLVGAIACRAHPLVLFLDDLQWADEMTLDVIRMILTDPDISHFLFLGCYRDNEVTFPHPLTTKLNAIRVQGVNVVTIKVGPIEKECVNTLLSEALCLPPSLCRPLSSAVHGKTGGIILFILKFLSSLNKDGDLWFDMTNRMWMYDLEQIRLKEIHGDVVSHMTEHMKSLSQKMRMGLKLAACLGPSFDAGVLEKARKNNEIEEDFLGSCVECGFLQEMVPGRYAWAHDQIQQAAYDLIPLSKRESFHLLLGSRLFMSTSAREMDDMIFSIVDNMNRGLHLIDDLDLKYEVSQLNLEAGEKALSASAFHSAAKYLLKGLYLLGPDSWEVKYDLSLRLYDATSEALFVIGDFSQLSDLIEKPLMHAHSFEDTLNIHNNIARALAASSRFGEGIAKCVSILSQLGERIPDEITAEVYVNEIAQVKQLLRGKTRQELLNLPIMSDKRKLAAMQFMNHALTMTYVAKPMLNPILVFRMVKMSIDGICNISAFAFACYGAWLVTEPTCDIEGGYRMGRVATEMTKRLRAVEMTPRLYATVYGFINIWKEPWQAGQSKHLEAYESGTATGDVEFAFTNLYQYTASALCCGDSLDGLSHKIESHAKRAFQVNQRGSWISFVVLHQLTFDLMGIKENAFLRHLHGMTEESCFTTCHSNNEISMCRLICSKKKFVAFFKGDMDTAAEMHDLGQQFPLGSTGRLIWAIVSTFIDGLIGFYCARKHRDDERKWTDVGLEAIQSLRKWVVSSEWNFSNKLYLLEAEYYFLRGDDERAMVCYNASITAAREHRFIHEEGLVEEKTATYLLHMGRHDAAMAHFMNAKKCYRAWGARAPLQRVDKAIAILLPLCTGVR